MSDPDPESPAFITMGDPASPEGIPLGGARDDALFGQPNVFL